MSPELEDDGTRRYYLDWPKAYINAFTPALNKIDHDWFGHVSNVTPGSRPLGRPLGARWFPGGFNDPDQVRRRGIPRQTEP